MAFFFTYSSGGILLNSLLSRSLKQTESIASLKLLKVPKTYSLTYSGGNKIKSFFFVSFLKTGLL